MDALPERADVVVVGGGLAGCATAWWLTRRGVRAVTVLEREPTLGVHASGRNAGMCRQLAEDDRWTALCVAGARFLREPPPGFADAPLLAVTGSLLLGDDDAALEGLERRARTHGVACRRVTAAEVAARVPAVAGLGCVGAVEVPDDGIIDTAGLLRAFCDGARRQGARVVTSAAVHAVDDGADEVRLRTARGDVRARVVVIAAGAWAGELGAQAGAPAAGFVPLRRHVVALADAPAGPLVGDPFVWRVGAQEVYVRNGADGLLASACEATPSVPGDVAVEPAAVARLTALLAPAPALAKRAVAGVWACQRTYAADGAPRLGGDPVVPWLCWAAGLGGHGATAAAAVGDEAAAAVVARLRAWGAVPAA